MKDCLKDIKKTLAQADIPFARLDEEADTLRILIAPEKKNDFIAAAVKSHWKRVKDRSKDLYLYGMEHFLYYRFDEITLIVCCQLACRSTLNGEWVPLDRKINISAIDRIVKSTSEDIYEPMPEDFLCYLLARCVYTNQEFTPYDISRIEACRKKCDETILAPKIDGVFFHFSDTMLQMIDHGEYDHIIDALWSYSDY